MQFYQKVAGMGKEKKKKKKKGTCLNDMSFYRTIAISGTIT